jgi:hypothetical protein|tara:strand:+ start:282 stop:461 length:180 start_codon:yes stop_codon:yes gene_type:complete
MKLLGAVVTLSKPLLFANIGEMFVSGQIFLGENACEILLSELSYYRIGNGLHQWLMTIL